jgi:hypothetical protein
MKKKKGFYNIDTVTLYSGKLVRLSPTAVSTQV